MNKDEIKDGNVVWSKVAIENETSNTTTNQTTLLDNFSVRHEINSENDENDENLSNIYPQENTENDSSSESDYSSEDNYVRESNSNNNVSRLILAPIVAKYFTRKAAENMIVCFSSLPFNDSTVGIAPYKIKNKLSKNIKKTQKFENLVDELISENLVIIRNSQLFRNT